MSETHTVIFWGAGATANLGMRMTEGQGKFITCLSGVNKLCLDDCLSDQVRHALGDSGDPHWRDTLIDLITILGDEKDSSDSIHIIEKQHLEAMARHWKPGAEESELRKRIMDLRLTYDWPALKDVVKICPGVHSNKFKINDLFNVMDMHIPLGHGFQAEEGRFLDARRLLGAKNMLKMLLHAMFYIDYQLCILNKLPILQKYYEFAVALGKRMQSAGRNFTDNFDRPEFIRGDVSFVSLNYDPIGIWTQFVAYRDLNNSPTVPYVGNPSVPLKIFHDMGHFIPSRRIVPEGRPSLWYPMNETSAQRLNEDGSGANSRSRLSKFLFPHGCLCWRECPDCGKLSAYHGDEWNFASSSLIPAPPLKGFDPRATYPSIDDLSISDAESRKGEKAKWENGRVDARACLHCGTLTFTHHTQTVMQSSFKQTPPSFIDEIQRDLRALVMKADHIIFMGYSLPPDDVSYRSFFAARRQRMSTNDKETSVRCTIIDYDKKKPHWIGHADLRQEDFDERSVVRSALDIFGKGNVRFYGGGVPNVFLDGGGNVSAARLEELLTWPNS
ncbi:MAG: hypothetical protein WCK65_10245 [Rhodospirillaceae bacterium]